MRCGYKSHNEFINNECPPCDGQILYKKAHTQTIVPLCEVHANWWKKHNGLVIPLDTICIHEDNAYAGPCSGSITLVKNNKTNVPCCEGHLKWVEKRQSSQQNTETYNSIIEKTDNFRDINQKGLPVIQFDESTTISNQDELFKNIEWEKTLNGWVTQKVRAWLPKRYLILKFNSNNEEYFHGEVEVNQSTCKGYVGTGFITQTKESIIKKKRKPTQSNFQLTGTGKEHGLNMEKEDVHANLIKELKNTINETESILKNSNYNDEQDLEIITTSLKNAIAELKGLSIFIRT